MHVCCRIVHRVVLFLFNEIRMEGTIEGDKFKEISSSKSKIDNTMQLIMKKLYKQRSN